jgi:hypothetical protein
VEAGRIDSRLINTPVKTAEKYTALARINGQESSTGKNHQHHKYQKTYHRSTYQFTLAGFVSLITHKIN